MTEAFACAHCGASHPRSELHDFRGELYCLDCLIDLTVVCDHCGQRFFTSEVHQEQDLTSATPAGTAILIAAAVDG